MLGYCIDVCSSGVDCFNGYGCMVAGSFSVKVCVKIEVYCNQGDIGACFGSVFCDQSPQLFVAGCITVCFFVSDCLQWVSGLFLWICDGVLCRRFVDIMGSLVGGFVLVLYYCDYESEEHNMCGDGLYMDFNNFIILVPFVCVFFNVLVDGQINDVCFNFCFYEGGCVYGFVCVGLGDF